MLENMVLNERFIAKILVTEQPHRINGCQVQI